MHLIEFLRKRKKNTNPNKKLAENKWTTSKSARKKIERKLLCYTMKTHPINWNWTAKHSLPARNGKPWLRDKKNCSPNVIYFPLIDCTDEKNAFKPIAIKSSEIIQIFINLLDSYASLIAFHQNNSVFAQLLKSAPSFFRSKYTQFRCNI